MAGRPDGVQDTVVGEVGVEPGGDSGWLTTATVLASCPCSKNLRFGKISAADPDPGSGAFFDPWIWDPGCVKSPDPG